MRELKLPGLSDRRREIDMVQTYKLLNESDSDIEIRRADTRRTTRLAAARTTFSKKEPTMSSETDFHSESYRGLEQTAGSAAVFKRHYRRHCEGTVAPT